MTPQPPGSSEVAGDVPAQPELLAMLGHELRNPLAPIRNSAALLRSLCRVHEHPQLSRSSPATSCI